MRLSHLPGGCQGQHCGDQAGGRVDRHLRDGRPTTGRAPLQTGSTGKVWANILVFTFLLFEDLTTREAKFQLTPDRLAQ